MSGSEVGAVFEAVKELHEVKTVFAAGKDSEGAVQLVAVPKGMELQSVKKHLDEYRDRPERREGKSQLETIDSLIDHTNLHKGPTSVLFATRGNGMAPKLVSVLDYHEGGPDGAPRFCRHRGVYEFPLSEEWRAWKAVDGDEKAMDQRTFARFLEERMVDIIGPDRAMGKAREWSERMGLGFPEPAKILELQRGLTVRVNRSVADVQNLSTGEVQMAFEETHSDRTGSPLKVPRCFLIEIPVFRLGATWQIPVLLRYSLEGARVSWSFKLYRTDATFDAAFLEACDKAHVGTELPLFYGSPES